VRSRLLIKRWRLWLFLVDRAGRFIHSTTSEGRWLVYALAGIVAATVATQFWPIPHFWLIPSGFGLLLLVVWAWKARGTMVIEDFADHTPSRSATMGAAALLSIELARIHDLFRVVDERNTLPTAVGEGRPLDAAVKVDDPTTILSSSVTPDTKLEIGPIAIPIGMGMAFLGRLVQGPRLRAELHESGGQLVLSVQLSGLRRKPSWHIERTLTGSTTAARIAALHEMIPELACRMFTHLGVPRKVRWRAMRCFTEALEIYRKCLRTPQDRAVKLITARQRLVEALAEDEDFVLVYYNLGVVFSELSRIAARAGRDHVATRHREKAEAAFRKAVEQDPGRWEAYYALARIHFERGESLVARELCERVLDLLPGRRSGRIAKAKAHDLIGHTYKFDPATAARHRRLAAKLALRALRSKLFGRRPDGSEDDPVPTHRDLAANCLANLAADEARRRELRPAKDANAETWLWWRRSAGYRRVIDLLELAQRLTSKDANLHCELGRIALHYHDYERAVRELRIATRIEPSRAIFWAYLAVAQARRGNRDDAAYSCSRVEEAANIVSRGREDDKAVRLATTTYRAVGRKERGRRLRARREFARDDAFQRLRRHAKDPRPAGPRLKDVAHAEALLTAYSMTKKRRWQAGQLSVILGRYELTARDPTRVRRAQKHFKNAINYFADYPYEISRHNVRAYLARALTNEWAFSKNRGKKTHAVLQRALKQAERAVSINPLSSFAHSALGHVYNGVGDLEGARDAWREALLWNPDDPWLHWELGFCYRRLAAEKSDGKSRQESLEKAKRYLEQAALLYPNERFKDRIRIHYTLARLYDELGRFDCVMRELRMVQRAPGMRDIANYRVAEAYRQLSNFNAAEPLYLKVINTKTPATDVPGRDVLDPWPMIALRAAARCGLAMSNIERQGDLRRAWRELDEVTRELGERGRHTQALEQMVEENGPTRVREVQAYHAHAYGLWLLAKPRIDEAIEWLSCSARLWPDARVYVDLTAAYLAGASDGDDAKRPGLLERARAYCELAKALDLRQLHEPRLVQLLSKLEQASLPPSAVPGTSAAVDDFWRVLLSRVGAPATSAE
jgi:tetratricopeptide (TPR) repeat protein